MSTKLPFIALGVKSFPQTYRERGGVIQCVWSVDDRANGGWFLFDCGLMLLWVMGVRDLTTLVQF